MVCVIGIVVTALAGRSKEGEMSEEQKRDTVKEFDFKKGILVATFSGIMSACFAFGLSAGDWIRETTLKVDMVNSAKAEGKTAARTAEPTPDETKALLDSLASAKLFKADDQPSLAGLIGILEEPSTLQAAAAMDTDPQKIAKIEAAKEKAATALAAIKASSAPLAKRVDDYAGRLTVSAADTTKGPFSIVDNLSTLSEKETALNVADSGADLKAIHAKHSLWTGLPVLIVVLLGGFTTNFIWCLILNIRNKTGYEYLAAEQRHPAHGKDKSVIENATDAPAVEMAEQANIKSNGNDRRIPRVTNYLFAALAGTTWSF